MVPKIPFNKPTLTGNEIDYISRAFQNSHLSGDGPFTQQCQTLLEQELGAIKSLLTTSCTHALEMAAILLECGPGDEIVVPSFTFVSTANAFVLRGARPVFADVRPDTLNIDETKLESLITPRTKAIVPVHYAGVPCKMDTIMSVAQHHHVAVVEDNAHGLFAKYRGKYTGTFGCLASQSFHETKNFNCGEGGALLINDEKFIERALVLREKGTNRSLFFRGQIDKYTWVDIGSSYLPSDILAAFLYAQLEARETIQRKRRQIWLYYYEHLKDWAQQIGARVPIVPSDCEQSYHMFYLIMSSLEERQALLAHLKARDIMGVFHYVPLHSSIMGRKFGGEQASCPVTEELSDRLLRLPFYTDLNESDQRAVVDAVKQFSGLSERDGVISPTKEELRFF